MFARRPPKILSCANGGACNVDIVVKRLHAEAGKSDSVTTGYFTRHIAQDVASRLVTARFVASALVDAFGATPYFAAIALLFRLLQSTFIQGQATATLRAMTVDWAINNVLIDRARRLLGSAAVEHRYAMRTALALAVILLTSCASEKLALAPPAGVDFSGTWKLSQADSDDPQRLLQNQTEPGRAKASSGGSTGGGPPGGGGSPGGGRGGKRGGRSGSGTGDAGAQAPPSSATLRVLGSNLSWPGKDLQIKQVGGTVELTSENITRIYRPAPVKRHKPTSADGEGAARRGGLSPLCGWSAKTLVVLVGDSEDDRLPVERHYGISEDGQRFVEVVGIKGHMDGFTMSRVWDRTLQNVSDAPLKVAP